MVRKIPHCWTKKRDGTCVKLLCTQDVEVFKNAKVVLFRWGFSFSVPLFTLFAFLFPSSRNFFSGCCSASVFYIGTRHFFSCFPSSKVMVLFSTVYSSARFFCSLSLLFLFGVLCWTLVSGGILLSGLKR